MFPIAVCALLRVCQLSYLLVDEIKGVTKSPLQIDVWLAFFDSL